MWLLDRLLGRRPPVAIPHAGPVRPTAPLAPELRAVREIECSIVGAGGEREPALLQPGTPVLHVAPMLSGGAVVFTTFWAPFAEEGWRPCMVHGELVGVAEPGSSDGIPIPIPPDYIDISSANPRGGQQ